MAFFLLSVPGQALAKDCPTGNLEEEVKCLRDQNQKLKDKARKYLAACEADENQSDKVIAQLLKEIEEKDKYIELQDDLILQKEATYDLQKKQSDHYEICCNNSPSGKLRFHVGIGATGSENEAAGLLGVGYKRFNVFAFMQDENTGVIFGYQF